MRSNDLAEVAIYNIRWNYLKIIRHDLALSSTNWSIKVNTCSFIVPLWRSNVKSESVRILALCLCTYAGMLKSIQIYINEFATWGWLDTFSIFDKICSILLSRNMMILQNIYLVVLKFSIASTMATLSLHVAFERNRWYMEWWLFIV